MCNSNGGRGGHAKEAGHFRYWITHLPHRRLTERRSTFREHQASAVCICNPLYAKIEMHAPGLKKILKYGTKMYDEKDRPSR